MPAARPRPPVFRALGADDPPTTVVVGAKQYALAEIYKHDSWAATAVYASDSGERIVCKFNRLQSIYGLPMGWLGRRLAAREQWALERLVDVPQFPRVLGPVFADGKLQRHAIARTFIPGHPLSSAERVNPEFFPSLRTMLLAMHERGIAYVDLHKRENVIVGEDGRPYLVDFQIAFDVMHPRVRRLPGARWVFEQLRIGDLYHLGKHVRRLDPFAPLPTPEIPNWLRLHRLFAVPFRQLRRQFLVARGIRLGRGAASTEAFAEDAIRRESARAA